MSLTYITAESRNFGLKKKTFYYENWEWDYFVKGLDRGLIKPEHYTYHAVIS